LSGTISDDAEQLVPLALLKPWLLLPIHFTSLVTAVLKKFNLELGLIED
jgi:hypothetical protein